MSLMVGNRPTPICKQHRATTNEECSRHVPRTIARTQSSLPPAVAEPESACSNSSGRAAQPTAQRPGGFRPGARPPPVHRAGAGARAQEISPDSPCVSVRDCSERATLFIFAHMTAHMGSGVIGFVRIFTGCIRDRESALLTVWRLTARRYG